MSRATKFGKNRSESVKRSESTDGVTCSKCLESKSKEQVEQVKDGRAYRYVCGDCQ